METKEQKLENIEKDKQQWEAEAAHKAEQVSRQLDSSIIDYLKQAAINLGRI